MGLARLVCAVGSLVGGMGNGLLGVQMATLLQMESPSHMLGRTGGVLQSVMVGGQLTGLVAIPMIVPGLLSQSAFYGVSAAGLAVVAICGTILVENTCGRPHEPGEMAAKVAGETYE